MLLEKAIHWEDALPIGAGNACVSGDYSSFSW